MIRCLLAAIVSIPSCFGPPDIQRIGTRLAAEQQQSKTPAPNAGTQEARAIAGVILDDRGQPVEGAQIILDRVGQRDVGN